MTAHRHDFDVSGAKYLAGLGRDPPAVSAR
jgi:hypothetical protein